MSDEAVVTLLGALHLVSAASLPAAAQQPGNTKCAQLFCAPAPLTPPPPHPTTTSTTVTVLPASA